MTAKAEASIESCGVHALHEASVRRAARGMPSEEVFADLAETFKVLSNQSRLKLIHALAREELCVCDLACLLGITDSAVSHQLRILRAMRLVKYRKEGKIVFYSLDDHHVRQVFDTALEHQQE